MIFVNVNFHELLSLHEFELSHPPQCLYGGCMSVEDTVEEIDIQCTKGGVG